ncbi:MAG: sialidase family protein, partial [Nitriliruptorales bacterium]
MNVPRMLSLIGAIALVLGFAAPSLASDPEAHEASVPTAVGKEVTLEWTGTIPPGANSSSECSDDALSDRHTIELSVPSGLYSRVRVAMEATIAYDGPATDVIVTLVLPDGTQLSGDSGFVDTDETVATQNPEAGTYLVLACSFASANPQAYTGTLILRGAEPLTTAAPTCAAPSASPKFEMTYVDETRAGGEPMIVSHSDGTLLWGSHAGTTHFFGPAAPDPATAAFLENYEGQTYQYVSDDLGESWTFVPRDPIQSDPDSGLPNSGFSDPDFGIDKAGNVYISEINLVNVAVSKSEDAGHTYALQDLFAFTMSDRQWTEADEENVVYMAANGFGGGTSSDPVGGGLDHFIAKSVDGGAAWGPAQVPNPDGVSDIRIDHADGTLYEIAASAAGEIGITAYREIRSQAPDDDFTQGMTYTKVVEGVGMGPINRLIDPTLALDAEGNLYLVWSDNGTGGRPAGIYYSYSTDRAGSFAEPVRVDPDARAEIWPWIAVGDPGQVAIVYLATDAELENNNAELAADDDGWDVVVAHADRGLGCPNGSAPAFHHTRATSEPIHFGTICQGGTLCQAEVVDRRLGDYFSNAVDVRGHNQIAVSDTRQGGSVALPLHIRQVGGPPLLGGPRPPSVAPPPEPAPAGDQLPATGGGLV